VAHNDKPKETKPENKPNKHWMMWSLVSAFILLFIVGMLAVDNYYAPDAGTVQDAPEN
jgi:hypothetical protein